MQLIKRLTSKIREWIRTNLIEPRNPWQRFYALALCCAVLTFALLLLGLRPVSTGLQALMMVFAVCMGLGFVCWAIPRHWESLGGKILVAVTTALTLPWAHIFASNLVSFAIGLPAQDFALTVSIVAGLSAIPISVAVGSLLLLLGSAVVLILAALGQQLAFFFSAFLVRLREDSAAMSDHAIGALVVAVVMLMSVALVVKAVLPDRLTMEQGVRWIAYYADYMPAAHYPGVGPQERIRLHENGVISTAKREAAGVAIDIREFTEPSKQNQKAAAAPTNPVKP